MIEVSQVVNSFVSFLSAEKFFSDLQSSSSLSLVVSKLPINLRESWFVDLLWVFRLSISLSFVFGCSRKPQWMNGFLCLIRLMLPKRRKMTNSVNIKCTNVRRDQSDFCDESHRNWKCSMFLSKCVKQRSAFVRVKQRCFTCLQFDHIAQYCSSKLRCRKSGCGKSLNSVLHNDTSTSEVSGSKNENVVTSCTVSRVRKVSL